MTDFDKQLRLAEHAETASLYYLFFAALVFPLTLETTAAQTIFMGLASISILIGGIGLLVPWQLSSHSRGLCTPSQYARAMHDYSEHAARIEGELYSLRRKIWEAEGRHSPLLKDTEFAFMLTEEEYRILAESSDA